MPLSAENNDRNARNLFSCIDTRGAYPEVEMAKRLSMTLVCVFLSISLWAQSTQTLSSIDFSNAEISQSGPDSFYVRNVVLPDQTVSLTIALNDEAIWEVKDIVSESENIIPTGIILDFATVKVKDDNNLELDWIIYKGSILRGVLGFAGTDVTVSTAFANRGAVGTATDYPKTLGDLLDGNKAGISADELSALREEYEEIISTLNLEKAELKTKADSAAAESGSLAAQIDKLKKDQASLQELKDKLEADNISLQEMIDTLKSSESSTVDQTVTASESLVQSYIGKLDKLQSEITSLRTTVSSLEEKLDSEMLAAAATVSKSLSADFDWAVATLSSSLSDEVDAAAAAIAASLPEGAGAVIDTKAISEALRLALSDDIEAAVSMLSDSFKSDLDAARAEIVDSIASMEAPAAGEVSPSSENKDRQISTLQTQIADLTAKNSELTRQLKELDHEIRSSLMKNGFIALIRPTLTRTLVSGFEPSVAQLGLWRVGAKSAAQLEKSMLFGKLLLPVTQGNEPVLYSFKARSTDPENEWVGLGLHIFVDNVEKRGYGLGDSLLVWLTRDQEVYKNDYTYLQLYRSDDDVQMDRVMDAVIHDRITNFVKIEVLYQPVLQYITISVDGEEKIRYKTWFGIDQGVQVALRSLGTAEFSDLIAMTTP